MGAVPLTRASAVWTLAEAAPELAELGGKAVGLVRLIAAGLPVPDGFVVTTAGVPGLHRAPIGSAPQIERHRDDPDRIARLFDEHPLPDRLVAEIIEAYADLGEPPVAVRSSATAEDLPDASFAGQQETYLNVTSPLALLEAVRGAGPRCGPAARSRTASGSGSTASALGIAVVVQELIAADAAGIMFTADPVSGATDAIEIDAAWGLGEAVVGGEVTPGHVPSRRTGGRLLPARSPTRR